MSKPIELRDYLVSRPDLVPSFEVLRSMLRPGEVAMVTEAWSGDLQDFRVWLRDANGGRTMGRPAPRLAEAIALLVKKLDRQGRTPR